MGALYKYRLAGLVLLVFAFFSCAVQKQADSFFSGTENPEKVLYEGDARSASNLTLDKVLDEAALYFIERLPEGAKIAIIPFDSPTIKLSDYVLEELWNHLEDSQKFIMVDRRNLELVDAEIAHQLQSGRVDDSEILSMTKQYGAETLIHGHLSPLGDEYRITVYATDVEKAVSSQRAYNFNSNPVFASLLDSSLEDSVERAVSQMAGSIRGKTVIAVGRISYCDTQTVSSLSAWLKNNIVYYAQKQRDKFQVASDSESAGLAVASRGLTIEVPASENLIQAVVTGSYTPLEAGAEVVLHLVSSGRTKEVLASAQFTVSGTELERRRLSLLPENDMSADAVNKFEEKLSAIETYSGNANQWVFIITPDVLDGLYYEGDFMSMQVYSGRDCFFRIIHVDVNGNTQVIYPAGEKDNNFILAGETRKIPDNFLYLMGAPFGEELILGAAYDQPFQTDYLFGGVSAEGSGGEPRPGRVSAEGSGGEPRPGRVSAEGTGGEPRPGRVSAEGTRAVPFSAEVIERSLAVEGEAGDEPQSPGATTAFSYTVLPRF